jgi:hypothetical protein
MCDVLSHKRTTHLHKRRTDTASFARYVSPVSKLIAVTLSCLLVGSLLGTSARAEGGPPYRRTTPRGSFGVVGPELVVGVPGGRAWGIESALMAVPDERSAFRATIEVADPSVREAFVRVAWYDRATGRPRQFALTDARYVRAGETATLELALDPPSGAVAYRLRVLGRLGAERGLSTPDAIRVDLSETYRIASETPVTRLLP